MGGRLRSPEVCFEEQDPISPLAAATSANCHADAGLALARCRGGEQDGVEAAIAVDVEVAQVGAQQAERLGVARAKVGERAGFPSRAMCALCGMIPISGRPISRSPSSGSWIRRSSRSNNRARPTPSSTPKKERQDRVPHRARGGLGDAGGDADCTSSTLPVWRAAANGELPAARLEASALLGAAIVLDRQMGELLLDQLLCLADLGPIRVATERDVLAGVRVRQGARHSLGPGSWR